MKVYDKLNQVKEQMHWAILPELPIVGTVKISSFDFNKLHRLEFIDKIPAYSLNPFFEDCYIQLKNFLEKRTQRLDIPLDLRNLSPFQTKVLQYIQSIPYGHHRSYGEIGESMKSKAYQAIGSACGANPLPILIPCHRVVGKQKPLAFAYGSELKKVLWNLEHC